MSYLALQGGKIHYQVLDARAEARDQDPTVVFLHGLIMDNLSSWFFTMANPVSQMARVLLYDLRGHGFSDRPRSGYSIADHVEDLKHLLDAEAAARPVILVGNSFGGLLALAFASRYQHRVQGLLLIDAQIHDANWKSMMLGSLLLQGEERERKIGLNFQNWLGRNSVRKSNRLAKNAHELIYETSLIEDLRATDPVDEELLQDIRVPCFAVYGEHSDILATGLRLDELIADFHLTIFPGCTHSVLWEKTDEVRTWILSTIQAFLPQEPSHEHAPDGSHLVQEFI